MRYELDILNVIKCLWFSYEINIHLTAIVLAGFNALGDLKLYISEKSAVMII